MKHMSMQRENPCLCLHRDSIAQHAKVELTAFPLLLPAFTPVFHPLLCCFYDRNQTSFACWCVVHLVFLFS